ncbi:hypothetical protein, partial [Pseudomonas sp.]|uniref:hypothetical protein n=1 Tax=Pseudomonas sp. TaxID=306 RepID=UPI0031D2C99A
SSSQRRSDDRRELASGEAGAVLVFTLVDVEAFTEARGAKDRQNIVDGAVVGLGLGGIVSPAEGFGLVRG